MMLNPLAQIFSPKARPKPYSLGRPSANQDPESLSSIPITTSSARTPPPVACSSHLEEQIQYLNTQVNQLKTSSESSLQQTIPLIHKFPLAHLKQVQYLHSVQLTVAQLHQDLESERLEQQTLQLLVCQLQKDIFFLQTFLTNQKTGTPPKQFSIDPPSAGTVTNPQVPETRELPRASTSQILLMGDSNTPKLSDSPSNLWISQSAAPSDILSKLDALEKQTKDHLSRQKSLFSSMQSNYSFLYDKIRQLEPGSNNTILWRISSVQFIFNSARSAHRQSKPINDKTTGYWSPVFRTHPYGYNFVIRFHP